MVQMVASLSGALSMPLYEALVAAIQSPFSPCSNFCQLTSPVKLALKGRQTTVQKLKVCLSVNQNSVACCRLFVMDKGQSSTKDTKYEKTTVKVDDPNPVWAEEFRLPVFRPDQELTLQMWDWDLGSPDDEIGQGSLLIQELLSGVTREVAVEMKPAQVGHINAYHVNQWVLESSIFSKSCRSVSRVRYTCDSALHAGLAVVLSFRQNCEFLHMVTLLEVCVWSV